MSNAAANPYAPPAARVEDVSLNSEAEAIRRTHINHEAAVKSAGLLYYLNGALTLVGLASVAVSGVRGPGELAAAALLVAMALGLGLVGWGVRKLRPWARALGCLLSGIGLFGFPVGTLINGYILYLLLSRKGRTIFSPAYQDVIAATPHIKYRTSIVVWIFLALAVFLLVAAVVAPFLASFVGR